MLRSVGCLNEGRGGTSKDFILIIFLTLKVVNCDRFLINNLPGLQNKRFVGLAIGQTHSILAKKGFCGGIIPRKV